MQFIANQLTSFYMVQSHVNVCLWQENKGSTNKVLSTKWSEKKEVSITPILWYLLQEYNFEYKKLYRDFLWRRCLVLSFYCMLKADLVDSQIFSPISNIIVTSPIV